MLTRLFATTAVAAIDRPLVTVEMAAEASGLPVLCSTVIPAEARIAPTVRALDLSAGALSWAQELTGMLREQSRGNGCQLIRKAGYDIADVALRVSKRYRE